MIYTKYKTFLLFLVCLIFQGWVFAQQQIENAGFEDWEYVNLPEYEPTEWSSIKTSDNPVTNQSAPQVWEQSTDAHSGNYSIKLTNVEPFAGIVATGTLTNGRVHATFNPDSGYVYTYPDSAQWHTVFTNRPDSLVGWYRYYPASNDHGGVRAILHSGSGALPEHGTHGNWIADANFMMSDKTIDTWTRFSVPFTYLADNNPEYLLIVIKAGNGTDAIKGSYGLFDDLELVYKDQGVTDNTTQEFISFTLIDQTVVFTTARPDVLKNACFQILDLQGRIIFETADPGSEIHLPRPLHQGIYLGSLHYNNGGMSKKFYID